MNFSVDVGRPDTGRGRRLHALYRAQECVVRSRSPHRILAALLSHLSALIEDDGADTPALNAVAFVTGNSVILAPPRVRRRLDRVEPLVRRVGIVVADSPLVHLGAGSRPVVVPTPSLRLSRDATARLVALDRIDEADVRVEPGAYDLAGWLDVSNGTENGATVTPARGVAVYLEHVVNLARVRSEVALDRLGSAVRSVDGIAVDGNQPRRMADTVAALFAQHTGSSIHRHG
ncbi:MAG: hypothetical protein ACRD29_25505 [Acidimicrobiales bacterium]